MLYTTLHNRILRLVLAVLGELIAAAALNLFIVPLSLYTGGLLGFCQLVRTLLQDFLGVSFGAYDIAGVLYFLLNIPLLMIGYRNQSPAQVPIPDQEQRDVQQKIEDAGDVVGPLWTII